MSSKNRIVNVAVVGAGGRSGKFMTEAILAAGKHNVTAITRVDSESTLPSGVVAKQVDYAKPETIVQALTGQDALVITLGGGTPKDIDAALVEAAAAAGVKWILPNEWSPDTANPDLVRDVSIFQPKVNLRQKIVELGKSSFIAVSTGFWYEWSLGIPAAFGFDIGNRTATFFDDGKTKISVSTWPQVGRAVAALLSLPIASEGHAAPSCLDDLRNQVIYVNSFTVSQHDMLDSVLRVTDTKASDWTITHEDATERYTTGLREAAEGKRIGFAKFLYTRIFYPDGSGNTEEGKGSINKLLGLPKEDIDVATEVAAERQKGNSWV